MTRYSLHLAVNAPDEGHFGKGAVPSLQCAHNDARVWRAFFQSRGWQDTTCWVGPQATSAHLGYWIDKVVAADDAELVVITWSGHGAQLRDQTMASVGGPESDDYNELWVLHDRLLFDDEVYALMARFRPPTRVVVIADSCHAGTSFKIQPEDGAAPGGAPIPRLLDREIAADVVARHKRLYDAILAQLPITKPTVEFVGLAACQDNESAFEYNGNGAFTRALLDLLNSGFDTSYLDLVEAAAAMTPHQHPRPFWYDKTTLLHQTVFT